MEEKAVLIPIKEQIDYWIYFNKNCPSYNESPAKYFEFRKTHDRDCMLTGGNPLADTIFSLWGPLKRVLIHLNPEKEISISDEKFKILEKIKDCLPEYLSPEHPMVVGLSKLFVLGKTRANVMLLPHGRINTVRGRAPYFDYMPHFLFNSFRPVKKMDFPEFTSNEHLVSWIKRERLEMFFHKEITKDTIIDLLNCGEMKAPSKFEEIHIYSMLNMYTKLIQERQLFYPE